MGIYSLIAAFALVSLVRAQTLEVPSRVLVDEAATIRAAGLTPNERVELRAELMDGAGVAWSSRADFTADAEGHVEAGMDLVLSMMPASKQAGRYTPPRDFGPQTIQFRLIRNGTVAATAHLEQLALADGVQRVPVHEGALRGLLFLPPGEGKHPGILVLGGSEGGMPSRRAAWFASHGYAALALAYFRYDDLPPLLAGIPLEYFGGALQWMANQPEIAADRIAVEGVSRGAELALQLGSMYPVIKAVVAYSPSDVLVRACCGMTPVPWAWTWKGHGLALRAPIEVEYTKGPILLISGDSDGIWQSSSMAESIVHRLKGKKFAYPVTHLRYPHAGHGVGRPELTPAWVGVTRNPTSGREAEPGGTPKGNGDSSVDAPPKVLEFLRQSLSPQPGNEKQ